MLQAIAPWRLVGLAAPMAVWALHFVVVYSLQGLGCVEGWNQALLTTLLLALTVAALLVIAWLGLRARRAAVAGAGPGDAVQRRRHFLSLATALVALLSLVAVVFTTIPILLLRPCA